MIDVKDGVVCLNLFIPVQWNKLCWGSADVEAKGSGTICHIDVAFDAAFRELIPQKYLQSFLVCVAFEKI